MEYGCDGKNKKCKGLIPIDDINFLGGIGLCNECYDALKKRTPDSIFNLAADIVEGTGDKANEMAEFIISLTE